MARLIGENPSSGALALVYDFVMKKLPDYIYAVFEPVFELGDECRSCDLILFIPHMGVFILDICAGHSVRAEAGSFYFMYPDGTKRMWDPSFLSDKRSFVARFLKTKFNISPLVYEMMCFPGFMEDPGILARIDGRLSPERVLFLNDLTDELSLMLKLYTGCIRMERQMGSEGKYDDLTDREAYSIFFYWESGVPAPERPGRPPMVFLSYNRFNQARALEIKTELENSNIFVWRAPEDVPIGEDYLIYEMEAIEACDAFLILLSSSSMESGEVRKEFDKAVAEKKKIIPILIEDVKPNEYYEEQLAGYQYRYMIRNEMSVMDEIIQSVESGRQVR